MNKTLTILTIAISAFASCKKIDAPVKDPVPTKRGISKLTWYIQGQPMLFSTSIEKPFALTNGYLHGEFKIDTFENDPRNEKHMFISLVTTASLLKEQILTTSDTSKMRLIINEPDLYKRMNESGSANIIEPMESNNFDKNRWKGFKCRIKPIDNHHVEFMSVGTYYWAELVDGEVKYSHPYSVDSIKWDIYY